MTIEFYTCAPVDDPNERRALVRVARLLWRQYQHSRQHFVLVGNIPKLRENPTQLDGLLFGPKFAAILEFKNYPDPIDGQHANRRWRVRDTNQTVDGGSRKNPYQQAVHARGKWLKHLSAQARRYFSRQRQAELKWPHLSEWVLFYPYLHPQSKLLHPGDNHLWLDFRSVDDILDLVFAASSALQLTPPEMRLLAVDVLEGTPWQALRNLLDDMAGCLNVASPDNNWTAYPIRSFDTFTIGRSRHQHIRLASTLTAVSGSHARLVATKQAVRLFDGPSRRGTFVNGERIDASHGQFLHEGDEILLGGLTGETIARLRFETRVPAHGEVVEATTLPTGMTE